ncbi:protein ZNRD2-like [Watersipora subatra]|uniref:protein ZNRD2-like n=1 Tax=Watersipora subatra TaxID=2589382 RepID=UPI00355C39EF
MAEGDADDWKPPTEAEMKVLSARRERQDKISQIMGQYLLKGYKMLGEICEECGTILLRDKQGVDYCVACKELTSDTDKDNPVMSDIAAASQVREGATGQTTTEYSADADSGLHYVDQQPSPMISSPSVEHQPLPNISVAASRLLNRLEQPGSNDFEMSNVTASPAVLNGRTKIVAESVSILESKLQWANTELLRAEHPEQILTLCEVIQKLVATLGSLKGI